MIKCTVMLSDDTQVFEAYLRAPPRVGEFLWATAGKTDSVLSAHGTSAFVVKEIAHWCVPGYVPPDGEPIHKMAVYVEPLEPT